MSCIETDEVKRQVDCRYVSACEAMWRIFAFDIHYRSIPVERLSFHLEGEQSIPFRDGDFLPDVLNEATVKESQFMKFLDYYKKHPEAKKYTYAEFPKHFVWDKKDREWRERQNTRWAVGRIYHVPIGCGELYYLRIMLNHVKGPSLYKHLRTVDGVV